MMIQLYSGCFGREYCLFLEDFSVIEVIFPGKSSGEKYYEDKEKTELYKISHHAHGTGEQLKRKLVLIKSPITIVRIKKNLETFVNCLL